jgi:hypothetical protein
MGEARGRLLRNLLGSLGILVALGAIAIGLPAIDRALPASRPVAPGRPYAVGAGVSLVPPAGAVIDVTKTRPGPDRGVALFLIGPVRFAIVVAPFEGTLDDAAARLRRKITETRGYQVTGGEFPVRTGAGLAGRQGGYTAPGRGGRYAVFLVGGRSIELTVSGTDLQLREALTGVEASTRTLAYREGP